jgi:hypothetical protein
VQERIASVIGKGPQRLALNLAEVGDHRPSGFGMDQIRYADCQEAHAAP